MLRYRLEGSGRPLLLIHGWGVTYAVWQNLAPLLTPYFQLIMIELPGVGNSPAVPATQPYYQACAEAIEEVRKELEIEQWAVLSYSSGTRAAEAYVQRYPQSVSQVIFLCPTYILEIWALFVRLLGTRHPLTIRQWIFSDWRLYNLVRALGFNGQRHQYTYAWTREIALQSLDVLVRSLYEMPGRGRAPFVTTAVPTLFIWGDSDALIARPRRLRPHDVVIPANHSAPMLAAPYVAAAVIPFLLEGRIERSLPIRKTMRVLKERNKNSTLQPQERRRLLGLSTKRDVQRQRVRVRQKKSLLPVGRRH
jgi:pimeloyl-ACP methyl ester carboxylesterase